MIKKENKLSVLLLGLVLLCLLIDSFIFIEAIRQNKELREVLSMNLGVQESMRTQLKTCTDMLKVYQEVDLYSHPE